MEFIPKCLTGAQIFTMSNEGYLSPCCWAAADKRHEYEFLRKEHLNIKNVSSIEEILTSKEWEDFYEILTKNPEQSPPCCKLHCCKDYNDSDRNYV